MPREARQSRNREVFRQVNERIADLADWFAYDGQPLGLICECVTIGCATSVPVPFSVYARLREMNAAYVVAPGHEDPEREEVVESHADYLIVRAREARRAAAEAKESAAALRAQAGHQVRRARRNTGD